MTHIKRGDTRPRRFRLAQERGAPIDLTTATRVRYLMRPAIIGVGPTVAAICMIESAASGIVAWSPEPDDVATSGIYRVEFEVTWADDTIQTVPDAGYHDVEIVSDLG